jgi:hypothetical protein
LGEYGCFYGVAVPSKRSIEKMRQRLQNKAPNTTQLHNPATLTGHQKDIDSKKKECRQRSGVCLLLQLTILEKT